jgi:hypothetical protein
MNPFFTFSKLAAVGAICVTAFSALAMDRFAALAQIESASKQHPLGNDLCVGPDRELSRYQISPAVIAEHHIDAARLADPVYALEQAKSIMRARCGAFEVRHHRSPTDFEFYILWHRPARLLAGSSLITRSEADRAQRFANLCGDKWTVAIEHKKPSSRI